MYHQGACIRWTLGFDLPDESKQTSGVVGDSVIRPTREVKLSDLSDFVDAPLQSTGQPQREEKKEKVMISK